MLWCGAGAGEQRDVGKWVVGGNVGGGGGVTVSGLADRGRGSGSGGTGGDLGVLCRVLANVEWVNCRAAMGGGDVSVLVYTEVGIQRSEK